jgi:hypothetical protein
MGKCKLEKREPAYILPPETYAEFKRRGKGIVTCRKERERVRLNRQQNIYLIM